MQSLANLISALATIAWPVIFGAICYKFYEPLKGLIDSVRGRKFTIKVAGNELTVEEASEQQRQIINDVQSKLADLEKRLAIANITPNEPRTKGLSSAKRILWVDDRPRNNSYLIASLEERGHRVDIATSTDEGIAFFNQSSYDIVVSDMGRPEDEKAGITLAKMIRQSRSDVPIFIFCGLWASMNLKAEAIDSGVTDITSSGTTLLSLLPLSNEN